jgi:hypothetical protein
MAKRRAKKLHQLFHTTRRRVLSPLSDGSLKSAFSKEIKRISYSASAQPLLQEDLRIDFPKQLKLGPCNKRHFPPVMVESSAAMQQPGFTPPRSTESARDPANQPCRHHNTRMPRFSQGLRVVFPCPAPSLSSARVKRTQKWTEQPRMFCCPSADHGGLTHLRRCVSGLYDPITLQQHPNTRFSQPILACTTKTSFFPNGTFGCSGALTRHVQRTSSVQPRSTTTAQPCTFVQVPKPLFNSD